MKVITNLLFKVTLSSMIVTAPAMITNKDANSGSPSRKDSMLSYYSSSVIKKFVNYTTLTAAPLYPEVKENANSAEAIAKAVETKMVVSEAVILYDYMSLEQSGLNEKAFEYAWRGYHNLLKKGLIRKKSVLSICDFSQSSCSKRMYVIDVRHKKLLYRTYVAHGQNSGAEYADSFSNEPDSYKSSLGFYITQKVYYGRNGLSLRIDGVDSGYNDLAVKRNIVLHGSTYVSLKYMNNNGAIGTSQGCPALSKTMSPKIIRIVKNGSCLFIYHPTQKYLQESAVINS
ncbi:MAG TPA: murein L,D-transpeptidase catalytic domain family protein [Puia sp.]